MTARSPNARSAAAEGVDDVARRTTARGRPRPRRRHFSSGAARTTESWFFESASGAPRTGIVDAVMVRIKPSKPDAIEVRLVQLRAGVAGLRAAEVTRLKKAAAGALY